MYHFGQFRKSQMDSFSIPLQINISQQPTETTSGLDMIFYNICGNLTEDNIVNNQNSYYLQFEVKQKIDSEQKFYLKLKNSTQTEDNEQLINTYTVPAGNSTMYFEVVFTPNAVYNQIIWELQRTFLDYQIQHGRIMEIEIKNFTKLINVLTKLTQNYPDLIYLTKIGIQGPPSMLMCINGEQIRIGRNGIYEINNEAIKITSINFIPKNSNLSNKQDYFIMDFEYN